MFGMNENHCKAAVFRNALKVIKHSGESYLIEAEFLYSKNFRNTNFEIETIVN
jgi:hypothetical protein